MTPEELRRRQKRADTEPLIVSEAEGGFRVHSPLSTGGPYHVTGFPGAPACTCPDFQHNRGDPEWRCKHVLAVMSRQRSDAAGDERPNATGTAEPRRESRSPERPRGERSRLLLKRSVSPDGRIDSLSVELTAPVAGRTAEEIASGAARILQIQDRIVGRFLAGSGKGNDRARRDGIRAGEGNGPPREDEAVLAELVGIRGTDGKWGRRLFLTVKTDGRYLRLYGSRKKLAGHIAGAGFPNRAEDVREGVSLNLPCRIVTRTSDDGYVSVERVLPADARPGGGR